MADAFADARQGIDTQATSRKTKYLQEPILITESLNQLNSPLNLFLHGCVFAATAAYAAESTYFVFIPLIHS